MLPGQVGYPTAMIASGNLPQWATLRAPSPAFPHIIHDSGSHATEWPPAPPGARESHRPPSRAPTVGAARNGARGDAPHRDPSHRDPFCKAGNGGLIRAARARLARVGWRRISARFGVTLRVGGGGAGEDDGAGAGGSVLVLPAALSGNAHNKLPVVRPLVDGAGKDAVQHLCGVLAGHARELMTRGAPRGAEA